MREFGEEGEEPRTLVVQNYQMQYIKRDMMARRWTRN